MFHPRCQRARRRRTLLFRSGATSAIGRCDALGAIPGKPVGKTYDNVSRRCRVSLRIGPSATQIAIRIASAVSRRANPVTDVASASRDRGNERNFSAKVVPRSRSHLRAFMRFASLNNIAASKALPPFDGMTVSSRP
jgi:hypothetical protein